MIKRGIMKKEMMMKKMTTIDGEGDDEDDEGDGDDDGADEDEEEENEEDKNRESGMNKSMLMF